MILILPHETGACLPVTAQPVARKNAVVGVYRGTLKVAVTAPPEDGRANEALIELLKDWLGVKRSQVTLLKGQTNRNKVFHIADVTAESLLTQVIQKLGG